jgi:hypothetical protein
MALIRKESQGTTGTGLGVVEVASHRYDSQLPIRLGAPGSRCPAGNEVAAAPTRPHERRSIDLRLNLSIGSSMRRLQVELSEQCVLAEYLCSPNRQKNHPSASVPSRRGLDGTLQPTHGGLGCRDGSQLVGRAEHCLPGSKRVYRSSSFARL